jgi:hypothetical protein
MSSTIKRQSEQKKSLPFLFCSFLVQWVDTTFTTTVQNRGAQIIAARGASSCASAVRDFFFLFSMELKFVSFLFSGERCDRAHSRLAPGHSRRLDVHGGLERRIVRKRKESKTKRKKT